MGKSCVQGFSELPAGSAGADEVCAADRLRRSESRHRQTDEGFESGVYEIALPHRGDAFRAVYAVKLGDDLWVVHAFQKKSTQGIKTPLRDIDLIRDRIKRLKEILR